MDFDLALKFILLFILGGVIGFEREINEKKNHPVATQKIAVLGVRTFSLTAALGGLAGVLFHNFLPISIILTVAFLVLTMVFYVIDSFFSKDYGITTEVALIYNFIFGILIVLNVIPIQLILAISVAVIFMLSKKEAIKNAVNEVRHSELNAFISFAIISLVILPFLPNQSYALSDIPNLSNISQNFGFNLERIIDIELINPFKLWTIVALITGVDLAGYVLEKTVGKKKGWILASIVGGFISSTATTQSLAQESKKSKDVTHLVSAAVIANLVSFIQIAIIIASQNIVFLFKLVPTLLAMILGGIISTVYLLKKEGSHKISNANKSSSATKEIINLSSALKFAGFYVLISVVSKIALVLFGNSGFLITTALGAMLGLDAVMINTSQIAGITVDFKLAIVAFILANLVNLAAKSIYSFMQGNKQFATKFSTCIAVIILLSLVGIFF